MSWTLTSGALGHFGRNQHLNQGRKARDHSWSIPVLGGALALEGVLPHLGKLRSGRGHSLAKSTPRNGARAASLSRGPHQKPRGPSSVFPLLIPLSFVGSFFPVMKACPGGAHTRLRAHVGCLGKSEAGLGRKERDLWTELPEASSHPFQTTPPQTPPLGRACWLKGVTRCLCRWKGLLLRGRWSPGRTWEAWQGRGRGGPCGGDRVHFLWLPRPVTTNLVASPTQMDCLRP